MSSGSVYLDWNATAPLRDGARAALLDALSLPANASSVHGLGREARRRIEAARTEVAALVGAAPEQVVFTSGGTEANNLALCGYAMPLAVSAVEHASVLAARREARILPVDADGILRLDVLEDVLAASGPMLVSVMAANNETGVLQPIAAIAALVHAHGGILHCDAVQAAGRIEIDIDGMDIDLISLSAHKLGGAQGVGALVVRRDLAQPEALLRGGGQESGLRAGTENVPGIAAFGAAAREARTELGGSGAVRALRDGLEAAVRRFAPPTVIVAGSTARLPNTSCLALPGAEASTMVMALDLAGIAVSAGAACSSGKVRASHVLAAMGLPDAILRGAIRVSIGRDTTACDIERFIAAWETLAVRLTTNRIAA
jgi:cysteine desulfurase